MKNFKQLRQVETIVEATAVEKLHAAALEASKKAKQSPSIVNHRAASEAHEKAIAAHEKAINGLIKKDGSAEEVKAHEQHIKMHKNEAQKHRFAAHRFGKSQQQNEETVAEAGLKDACWKGYEAIGTKMKDGREVPNCVPKEEAVTEAEDIASYHKKLKGMNTDDWTKEVHKHIGADKALGYSRKSAEHEILRQKFGRDAHSKYATGLKEETTEEAFTPNQGLLDRIKKDHEELKGMPTKDVHRVHQGQYKVRSSYTPAEVGGKQGMIADILRNRHGDKHVSHYFGMKEDTTTIEKPVAEDSDEQKNLKITKHEKAAVEAGKRGDKQAQQYHLGIVKNLQNESVVSEAKEEEKAQKHLVTVTVSDPHHTMQTKRKEKIMKRVKVSAADPKEAVKKAEAHYKKHGFKVHDSLHHSIVSESLDTDEFVDSYDPETDDDADEATKMAKAQLKEIIDMAQDLVDAMEDDDELEAWMQYKITSANKDLDDVYSTIAYGEDDDDASEEDNGSETDSGSEEEKN